MKKIAILILCAILISVALTACGHAHTYSADWKYDDNQHWHPATCGCENEKSEAASHTDLDKNCACDTCGRTAHSYSENGVCTVCGTLNKAPASLSDAVALAVEQNGSATRGYIVMSNEMSASIASYEIAPGYLHTVDYSYGSEEEFWYYKNGDSVWSIQSMSGQIMPSTFETSERNLAGYRMSNAFLNYAEGYPEVFGIVEFLDSLLVMSETGAEYSESAKDGKYGFSFVTAMGLYAFKINVEFTLDSDKHFIDNLTVDAVAYSVSEDVKVTYKTDSDGIPTDEIESIEIPDDIEHTAHNEIVWTQEVSSIDGIYSPDNNVITDFGLYIENDGTTEKITDTVEVLLDTSIKIIPDDFAPAAAILKLNKIQITKPVMNDDGEIVYEDVNTYVDSWDSSFNLSFDDIGEHTIRVSIGNTYKDVKFNVVYAEIEQFEADSSMNALVNQAIEFNPTVNTGANPEYTAEIIGDTANAYIDENGRFVATVAGSYRVKLTSVANAAKTATVIITVTEFNVDVAPMLTGKYEAWRYGILHFFNVEFTPSASGATTGTVVITKTPGTENEMSATFSYSFVNYQIVLTPVSVPAGWTECKLAFNTDYSAITIDGDAMSRPDGYDDGEGGEDENDLSSIVGNWQAEANGVTYYMSVAYWASDDVYYISIQDSESMMGATVSFSADLSIGSELNNFNEYSVSFVNPEDNAEPFAYATEAYLAGDFSYFACYNEYAEALEFTKAD